MIKISFLYNENKSIIGFDFDGHAGFAESGRDIVCAAVSALVFNTMNSIEKFTKTDFEVDMDEKKGHIYFTVKDEPDEKTELLLNSLKLGVGEIQKSYGKKYIRIEK